MLWKSSKHTSHLMHHKTVVAHVLGQKCFKPFPSYVAELFSHFEGLFLDIILQRQLAERR